jgi:hypothetical protein
MPPCISAAHLYIPLMAAEPPQPRRHLSRIDAVRIEALFACARCPFALAFATDTPVHEILNWLVQPHIQHHIDSITALREDEHRAAAMNALRRTIDTSTDPVESRRAATCLLRALRPGRASARATAHTRCTAGSSPPATCRRRVTAVALPPYPS